MRFFSSVALAIMLVGLCLSANWAQLPGAGTSVPGNPNQPGSPNLPGRGDFPAPPAGGGAQADFSNLTRLIMETIDPESWLLAGSGGTSTIIPYPAGVWVDPKGRLKRTPTTTPAGDRTVEDKLRSAATAPPQGKTAWQASSSLRMVSLKRLDQALVDISFGKSAMAADVIRLAGINQISFVLLDAANEDVILAGTADPNRMGYFLEDLSVVTALIKKQTAPIGCSIEPNQQRLLATKRYLSNPESTKLLSNSPKRFSEQLGQVMGDYDVQVFGMNPRSGTAVALVAADQHMKQLGFGKAKLPLDIRTYFDHLESQNSIPTESLIRWWFAYTDEAITTNPENTLFRLPENCVRVMSEQQFVTQAGRQPTGGNDPAADAFAKEMSQKLHQLRDYEPSYSRLCCVFETALALQLTLESSGVHDFRAWFPNICALGSIEPIGALEPKKVEGLVTAQTLKKKKSNVAVISGGVTIEPLALSSRNNWKQSSLLSGSAVPKLTAQSAWWWD